MPGDEDITTFHRLQRQLFDAFTLPGDPTVVDQLYSEDFFSINADGSTSDKQGAIEMVDEGVFPTSEEVQVEETMVRRFGDSAVVTGRSRWINSDPDPTVTVRHSQIWVQEDGEWQLVGWQGTPISE